MMLIEQCSTSCGYAAAFVSCLSFGSFALPMKGKAAKECDVHPLVFQTYKTLMCFLTSFSVLFLGVDKLTFSPWGIVSGLFWIPAGITYVCGIRTAGLAICHGTAASIIVMVSFSWGIFIFHERVRSLASALFAVFLMICGIFGMSFASAPPKKGAKGAEGPVFAHAESKAAGNAIFCFQRGCLGDKVLTWSETRSQRKSATKPSSDEKLYKSDDENDSCHSFADEESVSSYEVTHRRLDSDNKTSSNSALPLLAGDSPLLEKKKKRLTKGLTPPRRSQKGLPPRRSSSGIPAPPQSAPSPLPTICTAGASPPVVQSRNISRLDSQCGDDLAKSSHIHDVENNDNDVDEAHPSGKDKGFKLNPVAGSIGANGGAEAIVQSLARHFKVHYGIDVSTRQLGLFIAAFGAIWGGSVMVPLHYAGESAQGLGFVFSFAMGATLVNTLVWILCFLDALRRHRCDCGAAFNSLPSLHFSKMIVPGAMSGILWSIGNMASMISVTYLGEGVGYSMTQSAMLVSGMWGIFLFKEIKDPAKIRGWLASACLTISGILLLSYNHLPPSAPAALKKNSF